MQVPKFQTQAFGDSWNSPLRSLCSGIELGFALELLPYFFLGVGNFCRNDDFCDDEQIAGRRQSASAHAKFLAALGSGGNFDVHAAGECRHEYFRAERGFPGREFGFVNQIVVLYLEVGMFRETDAKI